MERTPGDVTAMVRLGAAYRGDGQLDRARTLLESALEAEPAHGGAVLFLGMTYEDLGELPRARELYEAYLEVAPSSRLRSHVEGRLPLLRRRELAAALREAIAQEARLANGGAPQARTVAVFPFQFTSRDSSLEPLSRAMAEMLTTDLSQTDRLTVLERARVQLLLDELQLGEAGLVDPASAARGGRLLGAERLVQGSVGGGAAQIELEAAIVQPWTGVLTSAPGAAPDASGIVRVSETDAVQRLFDAEKRLALRMYEVMGVVLTAAERERVNRRATENLQAILAYGRGLRAADAGEFALAAQHFAEAAALDPSFAEARARAIEAELMALASAQTTAELAVMAAFETRLPLAFEPLDVLVPGLVTRDPAQEVMGTEGYGIPTVVEVVIERPEGGN